MNKRPKLGASRPKMRCAHVLREVQNVQNPFGRIDEIVVTQEKRVSNRLETRSERLQDALSSTCPSGGRRGRCRQACPGTSRLSFEAV